MRNQDWKITCPHCGRRTYRIRTGEACPWCGRCSAQWVRWLEGHISIAWVTTAAILLIITFAVLAIGMAEAHASDTGAITVEKDENRTTLHYPNGDYEIRKDAGNMVEISGFRRGKTIFDYKTSTQLKVDDIEKGIYWQTRPDRRED